ncbi:putative ABC-2 type transporter [Rosa chinensis]|uniref:Putative ABC-2 type transporter n=1 Tax=Rosa chinensis TaxID=74649 RepID=A0A2P6QI48_ROSCH|nr:putative ABC-2 type transporter [Rosa chinensis]
MPSGFSPQYSSVYFLVSSSGRKETCWKQQDIVNLLGATYSVVLFLGAGNASAVQSVVAIERTVFYRERAAGMYSELPYAFAQGLMSSSESSEDGGNEVF